ncbi:glycoside hydrolase [Setomelanomma holmii]|uniref:endo-1,4-beta-xylanase n=1 Tax=Setomelanomma holmii TaxID=210430 RepID=A0A9P4LJK9_9PLEO|nr:glycoside hydrolase [Setomelanomma holmii]
MKTITVLTFLPLVAATPTPNTYSKPASAPSLGALAHEAGLLYFGTTIDNAVLNNTHYTSIAFNRSSFTQSHGNVFNYTLGDQIVDASKAARQIRRCHTFLWHNQLPDCKTIWLDTIGPTYIKHAFRLARKYTSPGTKLYYNDYGIERVNNKSLATKALVKGFLEMGVPIDGVGLQAQFTLGRAPGYADLRASQQLFTELGLENVLTELDSTRACVDEEKCVGVTVWDF